MKITPRKAGFTLVEIMIVVAIIGLLAAIAIPNFARSREKSQQTVCLKNRKVMEDAIQQWLFEAKLGGAVQVDKDNLLPYLSQNKIPLCPANGGYTFGKANDAYPITCDVASHTNDVAVAAP